MTNKLPSIEDHLRTQESSNRERRSSTDNIQDKEPPSISILGAPGSGKTTFLAVNFFLYQTYRSHGYLLEPCAEHPDSSKQLLLWEQGLRKGAFPDKTEIGRTLELHTILRHKNRKVSLKTLDPAGEVWDAYNPSIDNAPQISAKILSHLSNAACHLLVADSTRAAEVDTLYQHLAIQARASQSHQTPAPILLLLTKTDQLEGSTLDNTTIFTKRFMPKTFQQITRHYQDPRMSGALISSCSIGRTRLVTDIGNRTKRVIDLFQPTGFTETMLSCIKTGRLFESEHTK